MRSNVGVMRGSSRSRGNRGSRVVYKDVSTQRQAMSEVEKLKKAGYSGAFSEAEYISGKKKGLSVYAVARKKTPKGYKSKRIKMAYKSTW